MPSVTIDDTRAMIPRNPRDRKPPLDRQAGAILGLERNVWSTLN